MNPSIANPEESEPKNSHTKTRRHEDLITTHIRLLFFFVGLVALCDNEMKMVVILNSISWLR